MSLATQVTALATRVAQEFKTLRANETVPTTGTTGHVLTKTAGGRAWQAAQVGLPLSARLAAAAATTSTGYTSSGLSVTLVAGKAYEVKAFGQYRTAATTTGIGLRLGGTCTATGIRYTTTIWNANAPTQLQASALSTALLTTAVTAANTDYTWEIRGLIRVNAGGTLVVEYATEVNNSAATIQPDAYLIAQELT